MDSRDMSIRDMIHSLTNGKPFIFIIMAYDTRWDLYRRIQKAVEDNFNIACIRADELKASGFDLLAKIHFLINRSELVIAEISDERPNVFYEIGYSVAVNKPPLLLIEKGKEVPTDLRGFEVCEYKIVDSKSEAAFEHDLISHLQQRLNADISILRDMLEAPIPLPIHIVSSPKYPGPNSRICGQLYDTKSFGDHIGILGLISAFGAIRGDSKGIELVSAQHSPPDMLEDTKSFYLIGSRKVNEYSRTMLKRLQNGGLPEFTFGPKDGFAEEDPDWPVGLFRRESGTKKEQLVGKLKKREKEDIEIWEEDYGLVMRGPHPDYPGHLVLIMAGAHSLGTGAACMAATRPSLIQKIKAKLPEGTIENKEATFWALVNGSANDDDGMLEEDGVEILEVGVY